MKKNTILRPAMAMIELVFAIVIMGIVMMSAPMLIKTATKSGYVTIQQEAISEASSQVSMIMSYPWDEKNADLNVTPVILGVTNGNNGLNPSLPNPVPDRRAGTPMNTQRKFIGAGIGFTQASMVLGLELQEVKGQEDDMDDFNNNTSLIDLDNGAANVDNIERGNTVIIARTVRYNLDDVNTYNSNTINFNAFNQGNLVGNQSANIKEIVVNIQSANAQNGVMELSKNITLRAFACNIGSYTLEER